MLISAAPGVMLWPAAMIVWGRGYASAEHRHHCVHLVMAITGTLRVRAGARNRWIDCSAALIRPDAPHEVEAADVPVLIAFVDPESELGAALNERINKDISCVSARDVARWRTALGHAGALDAASVERWIKSDLLGQRRAPNVHPGVNRVLSYLRERLGQSDDLSLATLAGVAALSPSRFMHVFTQSVGVPLRPYILWLRLQRASGELIGGATVTVAAHQAGFSDAAHMTRTFRRMLGTTPSELARRRADTRGVTVS